MFHVSQSAVLAGLETTDGRNTFYWILPGHPGILRVKDEEQISSDNGRHCLFLWRGEGEFWEHLKLNVYGKFAYCGCIFFHYCQNIHTNTHVYSAESLCSCVKAEHSSSLIVCCWCGHWSVDTRYPIHPTGLLCRASDVHTDHRPCWNI